MADRRAGALGVDFGTTNTVVAIGDGESARVVRFPTPGGAPAPAFRSVLSVSEEGHAIEAGPWAIEAFLDDPASTRLIQSFKSFAASTAFAGTSIFGQRFQFEDLLFAFLRRMWARAADLDADPARTVIGRPVVFAGAAPDEGLALRRYAAASGGCRCRTCPSPMSPSARPSSSPSGWRVRRPCWWPTSAAAPATSRSCASAARAGAWSPSRSAAPASGWPATPSTSASSTG